MKKTKVVIILFVAIATIAVVAILLCRSMHPGFSINGTTLSPQESEILSIWQSLDKIEPKDVVVANYRSQQETIKAIADHILQYPMEKNERMFISNYDRIKIFISSTNSPTVEITDTVDSSFMQALNQLIADNNFDAIDSNYGNAYVLFVASETGMKKYNGVIITNGSTITKYEVESEGIMSSIFQELLGFEQIEENVYYFEAE